MMIMMPLPYDDNNDYVKHTEESTEIFPNN